MVPLFDFKIYKFSLIGKRKMRQAPSQRGKEATVYKKPAQNMPGGFFSVLNSNAFIQKSRYTLTTLAACGPFSPVTISNSTS